MALDRKNIIVGAARTFIGPSLDPSDAPGRAAVDALKAPAGTSQVNHMIAQSGWRDVGYTQDGLEVSNDPSYGEVEVDQLLDAALIFKDGMSYTVSTTFAEATLENLLVAWGQADSFYQGVSTLTGSTPREVELGAGELGEAPLERGLVAVGNATRGTGNKYNERTWFLYRVLSVDAATVGLARAEATTIPVSFRALPANNGKYGSVRDRVAV
jgi:hypothetical protein